MGGQNGGQMGRSKLDIKKRAEKSNVAEMPLRDGGAETTEAGGNGKKKAVAKRKAIADKKTQAVMEKRKAGAKKTKRSKKAASEKVEDKEEHKGAKNALRKAVKKTVKESSTTIAESLVKHAEDGDIRCAELVLSLMQKEKDGGDDEDDVPNVAEMLANEPSWAETIEAMRKAKENETEAV